MAATGLPDYLSGMLIGIEVAGALQAGDAASGSLSPITLIGDNALCARYALALRLAGLAWHHAAPHAATRGLWLIAQAAGLISARPTPR